MKNSADVGFNKLSFSNVFWLRVECTFQNQNLCQCVYEPYDFWNHLEAYSPRIDESNALLDHFVNILFPVFLSDYGQGVTVTCSWNRPLHDHR